MKSNMTVQEHMVNKILPSMRKSMSLILIGRGNNQRKTAKLLGLTEGAVSQYLSGKRGMEYLFSTKQIQIINKYVAKIIKGKDTYDMQTLCLDEVYKFE